MRALLLADRVFAAHERVLIERIAVGLVAEGIDVQCALPAHRDHVSAPFTLARSPIVYNDRGLAITQRIRAAQIARQIAGNNLDDQIDIVHVFGGSAWGMGHELGDLFGCPVAYEIWREGMVDRAVRMHARSPKGSVFFAPDTSIERALVQAGIGESVRLTLWGANAFKEPREVFHESQDHAAVLISSGREKDECIAAFEGLVAAIGQRESMLIFVNSAAAKQGGVWKRATELGVLDRLTVIEKLEDRRELVLRCDMLIYPDHRNEQRTILLDAMAHGMVIVAAQDDRVSVLVNHESASIVESATSDEWRQRIEQKLENPDDARQLARSARLHIQQHRRSGVHIASLVDAYAWMTDSGTLSVP